MTKLLNKLPLFSPALPPVIPTPSSGAPTSSNDTPTTSGRGVVRPVAVVTGATSGIGKAAAICLSDAGFHVIGTSRNPQSIVNPAKGVQYVALDLEKPETIATCAEEILRICAERAEAAGTSTASAAVAGGGTGSPRLTAAAPAVLVNNAGESQSGPVEELPREALERLFQTNVIGQVELTQKLLPAMRAAGRGRIVMVGSMLGSFPLAYRSSYVASKAALKGFGFSLRREVRPFGIGVSVVEPGSINTGLSQRRTKYVDLDGPYGKEFTTMLTRLDNNEANGISAEQVAQEIVKAVRDQAPRPLYATGSKAGLIFPLSRVLPLETTHWLLNKVHGL